VRQRELLVEIVFGLMGLILLREMARLLEDMMVVLDGGESEGLPLVAT